MNHYHVPEPDEKSGSSANSRSSETVLHDFLKLITEISSHDTYSLAKDIVTGIATLSEENKRLQVEIASSEQESRDLEAQNRHTHDELIKSCNNVIQDEKNSRAELQARLSHSESLLEKETKATFELSKANAELKQQHQELVTRQEGENHKLTKAEGKIGSLEAKIRLLDEKHEKQQENLRTQGINITKMKSKLKDAEDASIRARQDFEKADNRLRQVEGFSCTLVRDDMAVE